MPDFENENDVSRSAPYQTRSEFSRGGTIALSLVSTLPWLSFMVLPYEISVMGTAFGLSQDHASWIATAEMLALALSAVASATTVARKDKRLATGLGMAIASVGAAASLGTSSLGLFILARILFGGGLGIVAAATNALPADHKQPERIYAYMMVALAIVFSALIYVTTPVIGQFGSSGLFGTELAMILAMALLLKWLPRGNVDAGAPKIDRTALPMGSRPVLAAVTLMFVAQAGTWAYADQAGIALGMSESYLTALFTISAMAMLAGAAAAALLGLRLGLRIPLAIGFLLQVYIAVAIYCQSNTVLFATGVVLLSASSSFALPYLQGLLAEIDDSGCAVALSGAGINFGGAAGPLIGAVLSFVPGLAPLGIGLSLLLLIGLGLADRVAVRTKIVGHD